MVSNDALHNRAYGWQHRRRRARLLRDAIGMPCPVCGLIMLDPDGPGGEPLHLDHEVPLAIDPTPRPGTRIIHGRCNISRSNVARGSSTRTTTPQPGPSMAPGFYVHPYGDKTAAPEWCSVDWLGDGNGTWVR